MIDQITSIY